MLFRHFPSLYWAKTIVASALALSASSSLTLAQEHHRFGVALEGAIADDMPAARMGGAIQSNFGMPAWAWDDWDVASYWEISASYWESDPGTTGVDNLAQYGFTPFLRIQPVHSLLGIMKPFIEGGVGVHGTTEENFNVKRMGTEFAFGSQAGVGMRFGNFDVSYRFQHLSNAGLGDSNPGVNFHIMRVAFHFF